MVDWVKTTLTLLQLAKKDEPVIDPRFLEIKPRILSDDNMLKGLAALKTVLSVIPATAMAAPVLTLGDVGFRLWKRMALSQPYNALSIPPVGLNVMSLKIRLDPVLREHFGHLLNEDGYPDAREAFNSFVFVTDPKLLQDKYPQVPSPYIMAACTRNKQLLGDSLQGMIQVIEEHRSIPEVDQNIRGAVEALTELFPAMRDWSLVKSENFNEIVDLIDTVV